MAGISSICITGLFWETLGRHRGQEYYANLRAAVDKLIVRKSEDVGPINGRDKYFNDTELKGTWHCALSRNPDIVMFYTVADGTLNLAMLGTHHDYPSDGKNRNAAPRTATKVHNAIRSGHRHSPSWKAIPWRRPSDLVGHRELNEASPQALDAIIHDLNSEGETGDAFRRLHGRDLLAGSGTIEELDAWLSEVEAATKHVLEARRAKPISGEDYVARLVAGTLLTA